MNDLFMLITQDVVSYNLSGVLLLVFEIIENMNWLREKWRVVIKRLLFCYESSLLGELLSVVGLHHYITSLNRSSLKDSTPTCRATFGVWLGTGSLYLFEHYGWAIVYVGWKHRTLAIFLALCCVDITVAMGNKMIMLGGYHWYN
ncbi:hypothetical protein PHMEG_00011150 [Phytophthora megakarya]|uniref:Transmembrane protein n=1 Tax=Phytophthora megakarya TaxID=4795 RepID=A0A225WBY3_9STRA|nr:hypothetical protein PHMEG_00011150 [Phytophthora megakarya]